MGWDFKKATFLGKRWGSRRASFCTRRPRIRLVLEEFEPRITPSIYYVSPTGNDNNSGTSPNTPWQTINRVNQQAASGFQAGDQILFQGGQTFTGNLVFGSNDGGAAGNPVTISSYGSGQATIDDGSGGTSSALQINGASHIVVSNLVLSGPGVSSGGQNSFSMNNGIYVEGSGTDIQINNVNVGGFYASGINFDHDTSQKGDVSTGSYSSVSIVNSSAHDNGFGGVDVLNASNVLINSVTASSNVGYGYIVDTGSGFGIRLWACSNAVVENSTADYDHRGTGQGGSTGAIEADDSSNILFQHNEASYDNLGIFDGDGIVFDGVQDGVMQFNYTHNNDGAGLLVLGDTTCGSGNYDTARYNISQNDAQDGQPYGGGYVGGMIDHTYFYNNTIYMATGSEPALRIAAPTGAVAVANNNLVTAGEDLVDESSGSGTATLTGDNYWPSGSPFVINWAGATYSSLSAFQAGTGQEKLNGNPVGEQDNPQFINPSGSDFRLANSSPLASAGLTFSQFGASNWDPYNFAGNSFLKSYFDTTPRDYWGNILPNVTPSVGAYQVGVLPPNWTDKDIGSVPAAGSGSYWGQTSYTHNGNFTVQGSGDTSLGQPGLWGTADQLNLTSVPITGDSQVVARVTSLSYTDIYGLDSAGVMYRNDTSAGSAYVAIYATSANGVYMSYRASAGGSVTKQQVTGIPIPSSTNPLWLRIVRANTFTSTPVFVAEYSTDGQNWNAVGGFLTGITMNTTAQAGLFVSSGSGNLDTATFDNVQVTDWLSDADIGSPGKAGSAGYTGSSDTYAVTGGGADIWNSSDQFNFASKSWSGSGVAYAAVNFASVDSSGNVYNTDGTAANGWAKAGIMWRSSTAANAAEVGVFLTPKNGIVMEVRASNGATTTIPYSASVGIGPYFWYWVELVNWGNGTFTGLYATTWAGQTPSSWTTLGSVSGVGISGSSLVGLAVTAHNNNELIQANFSAVDPHPLTGGAPASEPPDMNGAAPSSAANVALSSNAAAENRPTESVSVSLPSIVYLLIPSSTSFRGAPLTTPVLSEGAPPPVSLNGLFGASGFSGKTRGLPSMTVEEVPIFDEADPS